MSLWEQETEPNWIFGIQIKFSQGWQGIFTGGDGLLHGEKSYYHQEHLRQNDQRICYGSLRFTISEQTKILQTNDTPGTPQLSVLSFHGGFHGNLTTNRARLSPSTSNSFTTVKMTTAKMIMPPPRSHSSLTRVHTLEADPQARRASCSLACVRLPKVEIVTKIVIIMMEIRSDPRFLISIFSPTITTAGTSTPLRSMWERTPQKTLDASQWLKRPLRLVRPGDEDDCDDDHLVQDPWQQQHRGWPVTGVIVEPIQAEGGDHHGSNAWFQVYNNSY